MSIRLGNNPVIKLSVGAQIISRVYVGSNIVYSAGGAFSPASLFANNEPGVWFDPSDLSTLYQDAAGTVPVTAVEQPVGLMLDKSKGLVLGPEQIIAPYAGVAVGGFSSTGSSLVRNGGDSRFSLTISPPITIGRFYKLTFNVSGFSGDDLLVRIGDTGGAFNRLSGNGQKSLIVSAIGSNNIIYFSGVSTNIGTATITDISVRELPGNHAFQPTTTSRPVLSARYNLLTKTERFDDGAWTKYQSSITANQTTAPDGTYTADLLTGNAVFVLYPAAGTYTISVFAKAASTSSLYLIWSSNGNGRGATFDLQNGAAGPVTQQGSGGGVSGGTSSIQSLGNGWYRCAISNLVCAASSGGVIVSTNGGSTSIYIWGASLVSADQAHLPYQRVNTATDYDTAGFPHYLRFDGVDDFLVTPTITPGIDKVQAFAGVRKLRDGSSGVIAELSAAFAINAGSLLFRCGDTTSDTGQYMFGSRGGAGFNTNQLAITGPFVSPITNTLTGLGNISGDSTILRVNGTQAAINTADQGTGNYLAYPLYIGRRGGTTFPFNGHLYSLIVRFGSNLPAATIENTEKYINGLTKAY